MPRDLRVLLGDIQRFIAKLERFSAGKTLVELRNDEMRASAIQLEFVLIAEALSRMERISPEVHDKDERVREIASFRNVIVHDYDHVDLEIVWETSIHDVPILKQQIDAWAAELGMETPETGPHSPGRQRVASK